MKNTTIQSTEGDEIVFPQVHIPEGGYFPDGALGDALENIMLNGIETTKERRIIRIIRDNIESKILLEEFNSRRIKDINFDKIDQDFFMRGSERDEQYIDMTKGVEDKIGVVFVEGQEEYYTTLVEEYFREIGFQVCVERLAKLHMDELIAFGRGEIKLRRKK